MAGARDGQLRIRRGDDSPPWGLDLYDDAAVRWRNVGLQYRGTHDRAAQYTARDVVVSAGGLYICTADPVVGTPDTRVDTFDRADASAWGTASDGSTWLSVTAYGTDGVASARGVLTANADTNVDTMSLPPALGASDVDILVRWAITSADGAGTIELRLDAADGGTGHALLDISLDGTSLLVVAAGSGEDDVAGTWAGGSGGANFWTRWSRAGATFRWRTWADGSDEPVSWDGEYTTTRGATGTLIGLTAYVDNVGDTAALDHYSATTPPLSPSPADDSEHWAMLASPPAALGVMIWHSDWVVDAIYPSGSVVRHDDHSYVATSATVGDEPGVATIWELLA